MLRQIGVEGVVTSLHDVPNGEIWSRQKIRELKDHIAAHGMRWSVVESLPVSESIKYGGPDRDRLIENYKESLRNLAAEGVRTVCYNFMPVIDWIRTDLDHTNPDGTSTLYFSYSEFAYFDIYIVQRDGAREDWSAFKIPGLEAERDMIAEVDALRERMTSEKERELVENIILKTQGFISGNIRGDEDEPVEVFRRLISLYDGISKEQLRNNLCSFLSEIMPVCDECGIDMCIHPDDPPFPVLGLPRIVTSAEDMEWILKAVDNPHNGLTFCAGSLSAVSSNDVVDMATRFADRTHFAHLRSCNILENGDFVEASHLGGRADLVELVRIFKKTGRNLPMRVDHGVAMLDDASGGYNPGYAFLGRMFAMGQVQGIIAAVEKESGIKCK